MKKNMMLGITLMLTASTLRPITKHGAYGITAGVGMGTFFISSLVTKHTVFSLLCSVPTSVLAYFVSMSMTPDGRLRSAVTKINRITRNIFAEYSFDDTELFIQALQDQYTDQFWLITSHDDIDLLLKEGYHALELLTLAKQEAYDNCDLIQKTNELLQITRTLMTNLTAALRRIKNHIDFSSQRAAYHQLLIEKERLAIEREKAYAQHSQANAMWYATSKR